MGEKILVLALLLAIGIVAYDEVSRQNQWPPRPYRFVGVALIFSVLAVVAVPAPALAAAFGIATDIGLVIRGAGQSSAKPGLGTAAGQVPMLKGSSMVAA